MEQIEQLLDNLKNEVPFALSRFNDGEMLGLISPGSTVARGDQYVDITLSTALAEALTYEQKNYWVGLPCSVCFPQYSRVAKNLVRSEYQYQTHAVVLTNRNWKRSIEEIPKLLENRTVYWVSGNDQDISKLSFVISEHYKVPTVNAWKDYSLAKGFLSEFEQNSIVIVSCGPMSRVLVKEWFSERPDLTVLDAGSTWDPFTRNVWHNCHKGTLAPCSECN